jgi:uncharacterized protein (TIGR00375 family)
MKVISDLHLHSRFSRAVSPQMNTSNMSLWAKKKGIDLLASADFTHPLWFRELQMNLVEKKEGIFVQKDNPEGVSFLLSTEVSCIYTQGGKGRRIHLLIFAPSFATVEKINKEITLRGGNLLSDGRPILGMSAKDITEIVLSIDERCLIIPAHAWTPHFSLYGSISGFDSLEECFGDLSSKIYAIETGLSSDPAMNWRIEELRNRRIVSFSDAHSMAKMGREATVFDLTDLTYANIAKAIKGEEDEKIDHTIEFYPEEGKYHYTGHRNCKVVYSPNETRKKGTVCPVCGRKLTVGVASRVEELARVNIETERVKDENGVIWIKNKWNERPSYAMIIPLQEIISEAVSSGVSSQKTLVLYESLVNEFNGEFNVLLVAPIEAISKFAGVRMGEGVSKVRSGNIVIEPGYDGTYGVVKIWKEEGSGGEDEKPVEQESLF